MEITGELHQRRSCQTSNSNRSASPEDLRTIETHEAYGATVYPAVSIRTQSESIASLLHTFFPSGKYQPLQAYSKARYFNSGIIRFFRPSCGILAGIIGCTHQ